MIAPEEHRDLDGGAAVLGDRFFVGGLQRRVAGAEVDDLALDRRDAGARADGLVVDGQARLRGGPLFVDGGRERRAGAGDRSRARGGRRGGLRRRCAVGSSVLRSSWCSRSSSCRMPRGPSASSAQPASAPILFLITGSPLTGCRVRRVRRPTGLAIAACPPRDRLPERRSSALCVPCKRPLQPGNSLFNRRCPPCEHFVKAGVGSGSRIPGGCG